MRSMYDLTQLTKPHDDARKRLYRLVDIATEEISSLVQNLKVDEETTCSSISVGQTDEICVRNPLTGKEKGVTNTNITRHWDNKSKRGKGKGKADTSTSDYSLATASGFPSSLCVWFSSYVWLILVCSFYQHLVFFTASGSHPTSGLLWLVLCVWFSSCVWFISASGYFRFWLILVCSFYQHLVFFTASGSHPASGLLWLVLFVWFSACVCIIARKFCRETMAAEEAAPMALNYIPEVVLKKRKNNEEWAIRRKLQLQERVKRRKSEKFAIKKPEQFIREFRDKVKILAIIDW
ncbi:hypothetical protein F511_28113 [Dorcoceras hygrometricum]|uniref:Uncharacterized protein n=1 Tax=Dorcoceras hygrometricum TaxID=472368 RepID=A0A2Z7C902_9LAMI|nr:hypothetical protein F511_28113 [Dorcoceras hygrometricum]